MTDRSNAREAASPQGSDSGAMEPAMAIPDSVGEEAPHYTAQQARGGEIILRTRSRRLIFISGLIGIVLIVVLLRFARFW